MDVQDGNGQEPLHIAAIEGHSDLVLESWTSGTFFFPEHGRNFNARSMEKLVGC